MGLKTRSKPPTFSMFNEKLLAPYYIRIKKDLNGICSLKSYDRKLPIFIGTTCTRLTVYKGDRMFFTKVMVDSKNKYIFFLNSKI